MIEIKYDFDVAGRNISAERIALADSPRFISEANAQAFLNEYYPVGKVVTVYCDPDSPGQSVLER